MLGSKAPVLVPTTTSLSPGASVIKVPEKLTRKGLTVNVVRTQAIGCHSLPVCRQDGVGYEKRWEEIMCLKYKRCCMHDSTEYKRGSENIFTKVCTLSQKDFGGNAPKVST